MAILTLPKVLHLRSMLDAMGAQVPPGEVITAIDFRDLGWVHPSGMAILAALCADSREKNAVNVLHAPSCRASAYLQDMDFFTLLQPNEQIEAPRRPENRAFARMVRVEWQSDSSGIARNLAKLVSEHGKPIHGDLTTCLEESVQNIIDHARKPG